MDTAPRSWSPQVGDLVRVKGTAFTRTVLRTNGWRQDRHYTLSAAVKNRSVYWIEELEPAPIAYP
jgi:hypothetical protein